MNVARVTAGIVTNLEVVDELTDVELEADELLVEYVPDPILTPRIGQLYSSAAGFHDRHDGEPAITPTGGPR